MRIIGILQKKVTDQQKPSDTQTENFHIHSFTLLYVFLLIFDKRTYKHIYEDLKVNLSSS